MDGEHVMVPGHEYARLCECESFLVAMLQWLNEPENYGMREWFVEQLTDESLPDVMVGGSGRCERCRR